MDDVLVCGKSIVIPKQLRPTILKVLGSAHQGVVAMKARARDAVYWPGLGSDIEEFKKNCLTCRQIQPSQVHNPVFPPRIPSIPFESIVADYFDLAGKHYLVIADRLSGWPEVLQVSKGAGAAGLCTALRQTFVRFGVPADCSTDGGPELTSQAVRDLFQTWGVHHIISSAYLAKSNGRAELSVKATKRLLRDNIAADGSLDTDKFIRAMLTKRNTPDSYSRLSPAEIVMGRKLSGDLPILPKEKMFINNEYIDPRWRIIWRKREEAMQEMFNRNLEKVSKSSRHLKPLKVGQHVLIQNQMGPHPLRWDRTGVIVDCKEFDQYIVKVHGSNRLTLRNRRFIRPYDPPAGLGKQFGFPSDLQNTDMNKGAGKQRKSTEDVHVPVPVNETLGPQELSQRNVDPRSDEVSSDMQDQVHYDDGQADAGTQGGQAATGPRPVTAQGQVGLQPPAEVRRSGRSNKGETSRFKDFIIGEEVEEL